MVICSFCSKEFGRKDVFKKHLIDRSCKMTNNLFELHEKLLQVGSANLNIHGNNNHHNNNINVNVILDIKDINSINKLTTDHIEPEKMKDFIEKYSYDKLSLFLSEYIKDIICNKELPQNHSVKYITKNPPRFNSLVENDHGEKINVIKNLKDSCEVLSQPVLVTLKKKLNECLKKYKNDEEFITDCDFEIKGIRKELNKECVKRALRSVLQNDILTDIEMKLTI